MELEAGKACVELLSNGEPSETVPLCFDPRMQCMGTKRVGTQREAETTEKATMWQECLHLSL